MEMEDKIIQKLVELDAKLDSMATADDLQAFQDEVRTNFDHQGEILKRLDQERLFTVEHVRRIEVDVEMLKRRLHVA